MSNPIIDRRDADGEHIPPHIAAEMTVLGALMQSPAAIDEVTEVIGCEDFYRPQHRAIFEAITSLRARNEPTDPLSVGARLAEQQEFLKVGGAPYLHDLFSSAPITANVTYYADLVLKAANNRRLGETATRLQILSGLAGDQDQAETLERAVVEINELQDRIAPKERDAGSWSSVLQRVMDEADAIQSGQQQGLPSGFPDLDRVTNGLHPGHLTVFGARPGVGKSTVLADIARHVAFKQDKRVLFVSLEMSDTEIGQRIVCADAGIRIADYRGGHMTDQDWTRLARTVNRTAEAPLHIERVAARNVWAVSALIRRYRRRYPDLALVVIDYLQKLKAPDASGKRAENRVAEVGECSWALKEVAVETDLPVVTAAQLNRASADKLDEPPRLIHLRESGEIEQDSDEVVLIHRPDAEKTDSERAGDVELHVAKNRFGPQTVVHLRHQMHYGRFVSAASESQASERAVMSPEERAAGGSPALA